MALVLERKLAVILAADVAGYSRMVAADEEGTLAALATLRTAIGELVAKHGGRVFGHAGDSILAEFPSAVRAAKAAVAIQQNVGEHNADLSNDRRMDFRIGLHLGDVVVEGADLLGDGVNVAARLQQIAEPAGILVSGVLYEHLKGRLNAGIVSLGEQSLKNIPRPVSVHRIDWRKGRPEADATNRRPGRTQYSIAVLPFDNISGDSEQSYLSEGITEDITTELSRFRGLAVAARHASSQFGAKGATIAEVRRALGVDYVVEGSVRRTGERLRITVQLIDATSGNHVWAERFDREASGIYTVLDEVVGAISANVDDRVTTDAAAHARRQLTESWSAYDYLLQGRELCNLYRELEAIPFFERAVTADPQFAPAHGWLGLAQSVGYLCVFDRTLLDQAVESGQRALSLDATEATGHWACAMGLIWKRQLDAAGRHFDRAIALNPANLQIRADWANLLRYQGRPDDALTVVEGSLQQGPFAPGWFHAARGEVLFDLRRYGEAIDALENLPTKSALAWAYLVAAHGFGSDQQTSAGALTAARQAWPLLNATMIATVEPYTKSTSLDHLLEGLRRAGMQF